MTEENFFIGIGGTGARVLEAFVHCCAAGFGPKGKVHLLLIDPDKANGNLNRTRKLVGDYCALWAKISPELEAGNPAFRTELVVPKAGLVWEIFDEQTLDKTLAGYIKYVSLKREQPALQGAADLLFTEQELTTPLNEGFRGHPAIGAVVMANPPFDDEKSPLWALKSSAGAEKSARVFLVGSIFGGTGAAGFPTIGKVLHKQLNEAWGGKLLLGGALVLPYFQVPPRKAGPAEMFVTSNDFPAATKAALRYYDENELKFDQYYFVGDSLAQEVGEFAAGAGEQQNDPHYVELVTALAGFDFFGQAPVAPGSEKQYFVAGRNSETVGWADLPISRKDGSELETQTREFREDIAAFTVFCYTYLTDGLEKLDLIPKRGKSLPAITWIRDTFNDFAGDDAKTNPNHDDNSNLLRVQVVGLANAFLGWITGLAGNELRDNGRNVKLIDRAMLLDRKPATKDEQGLPQLPLINPPAANLGQLVHGFPSPKNMATFVVEGLNALATKDSPKTAAYRLLNLYFRAARQFVGAVPSSTSLR